MKKIKVVLATIAALSCIMILSGCDLEDSDADIKTDTITQIGKSDEAIVVTPDELQTSTIPHTIDYNGLKIKLKSIYGIDKKRLNNWWFTTSSTVNLELAVDEIPDNVEVAVNNVYSEVAIISTKAYKNGIRQDSVNQSYSALPNGGMNINEQNNFTLPFQVEGINQNETSFYVLNGYGSSTTTRLSESAVREDAQGGVLNTVWTIIIKDKGNNETYMRTINDKIGLPCVEDD